MRECHIFKRLEECNRIIGNYGKFRPAGCNSRISSIVPKRKWLFYTAVGMVESEGAGIQEDITITELHCIQNISKAYELNQFKSPGT